MLRVSKSDPVQQEAADEIERLIAELAALANRFEKALSEGAKRREERDAALANVAKLREALEFYANRMTYTARSGMECGITRDSFGDRARAVLKETKGE
jgi:hypothetical protein